MLYRTVNSLFVSFMKNTHCDKNNHLIKVFQKFGGLRDENKKKKKIIETGKKTIDVQLCKLELVVAYRSILQFKGNIKKPVRLFIYSFSLKPQEEPSYRTDYYIGRLLGDIILLISCAGILEQSMGAIGTK
jgi:hypothetical protein